MRMLPRSFTTEAVLVFFASAVLVCGLGIGGAWIFARVTHPAQRAFSALRPRALPAGEAPERLRGQFLSGEECARVVRELSPESLRGLLREGDANFWRSNPNAGVLLRHT